MSIQCYQPKTSNLQPVTMQMIWEARKRIAPMIKRTPLILSSKLSERVGSSVYLKLENLQHTGAFKVRGAANKILSLTADEKRLGVTTFSTGNHGRAVAFVAQKLGIKAVICISKRVPKNKVEAIERLGAQIEISGDSQDDAEKRCDQLQKEEGLTVVSPFDDPYIIAGQGTMGLEILENLPEMDQLLAGLSGGGLICGTSLALKSNAPTTKVIGLSMERGAVMYESLKKGKPVILDEADTLADSLLGGLGQNNQYTFEMTKQYVDESLLISEEAIAKGMAYMYAQHGMVVEGAAAVGIGALLGGGIQSVGENIVIIISGCNIDTLTHHQIVSHYI